VGKWTKLTIGVVAGLLLLTACSKSDNGGGGGGTTTASGSTTTSAPPQTVTAEAFAASVCGGMNTYLSDIQTLSTDFSSSLDPTGSPQDQLNAVAGYLDSVVAATDDLVTSMQAAGVPDVDGGQEAADALSSAFTAARDALQSARDQVDSLPTDDPAAFAAALTQLGTDIQTSMTGVGDSLGSITSSEIDQAFQNEASCQSLVGVGTSP
jgi:hypothetical protein